MLEIKDFNANLTRHQERLPHGLSRTRAGGTILPAILGLACAALVLAILWLAYTFA
ncbi:MAG: hypothetical protein KGK02_04860 [Rhodospirillales bacterium]|nr:hypothetical protein [Rhodospirillales bacterium]